MHNYEQSDVLYHYGRKGMKWYQNIFGKNKAGGGRATRKAAKEEQKEEAIKAKKEKILKSRSAKELFDNAHLFNDKELTAAYNRLNTERNIQNLIPAHVSKGKKFLNSYSSASKNIKDVVDSTETVINSIGKAKAIINKLAKAVK